MEHEPLDNRHSQWDVDDWRDGFASELKPLRGSRALLGIVVAIAVMGSGVSYLANLSGEGTATAGLALTNASDQETPFAMAPAPQTKTQSTDSRDTSRSAQSSALVASNDPWGPRVKPARSAKPGAAPNNRGAERGFWPSLKPNRKSAQSLSKTAMSKNAAAIASSTRLTRTIGGPVLTPDYLQPVSVFFGSDVTPDRTPPPPLAVALSSDLDAPVRQVTITMKRGETFVDVLKRARVLAADRNSAAVAFGKHQSLRRLRPGQTFTITTAEPNQTLFQHVSARPQDNRHLLNLRFRPDSENQIELARSEDGTLLADKIAIPITKRLASVSGHIEGSLFLSAKRAGAPDKIVANLANMFVYDIDFQRDIFGGDQFEAVYELYYDDEGALVGSGDVLYGRMKWRGRNKEKGYYRFTQPDGRADYFDRAGQSARRLLMKTPIDGARLSSGFGTRKHPILGYRKAHKGVDFAARRGTPVYAAGDGVVERANRYGSFGNYIRIRHANGYKTAYAHLNGFRRGVRAGKRVRQGDVIGYVGTTGRSTGPHLHYEVHHKGRAVNPQRLKIATGVKLKGAALEEFRAVRTEIDATRLPEPEPSAALASDEIKASGADAL